MLEQGSIPLSKSDPEIFEIIKSEERRQRCGLELIASENFTSYAVMEAVGSCLTNKYSEGLPGRRYYGGTQEIDKLENICCRRALELFGCDENEWGVNVQPYSGSVANFAAFTGLLEPGDRFMGLNLPDGGHLSHGFFRKNKAVNISAKYFTSIPYYVDPETGYIDYDDLERTAKRLYPRLIVGGSSAYPRDWDYVRMRQICNDVGAYLLIDMAHYSGLVAAHIMSSPFEYADVVTTTTHKSLRGTRSAIIFFRKSLEKQMNYAVFPATQGGPHNHAIAGVAVALREALQPSFQEYARQIVANCKHLAAYLQKCGHKIVTGGTDCHLFLWDVRPHNLTGSKVETLCDMVNITINKNAIHGDKSGLKPGGVRIGTPALTSRGFKEKDMEKVGEFLNEACQLCIEIQSNFGEATVKLNEFKEALAQDPRIKKLGEKVIAFSESFYMPGKFL